MALNIKTLAQKTVTTAGTRVQITTTPLLGVEAIYLSAPAANTGIVFIGDSSVAAGRGVEIAKGTTFTILSPKGEMLALESLYVDAATSGDKLNITYVQRAGV